MSDTLSETEYELKASSVTFHIAGRDVLEEQIVTQHVMSHGSLPLSQNLFHHTLTRLIAVQNLTPGSTKISTAC
jgi:hypothetical protein